MIERCDVILCKVKIIWFLRWQGYGFRTYYLRCLHIFTFESTLDGVLCLPYWI